jgi:hypothetical protein
MKNRAIIVMDRSRKSLDREQDALQQVQEVLELKESGASVVSRAIKRENYCVVAFLFFLYFSCLLSGCDPSSVLPVGSFLDTVAEEQHVNSRVEVLLELAKRNNIDFWADEDRTRRIVRF